MKEIGLIIKNEVFDHDWYVANFKDNGVYKVIHNGATKGIMLTDITNGYVTLLYNLDSEGLNKRISIQQINDKLFRHWKILEDITGRTKIVV